MGEFTSVSIKKTTGQLLKEIIQKTKTINKNREPPIKITRDAVLKYSLKQIEGGIKFD